ncbi:hypothetical protein ABPG74_019461 [Tetrahymena malaccensis]
MQMASTFEDNYFSVKNKKSLDNMLNNQQNTTIRIADSIYESYFPVSQNYTQAQKPTFSSMETMDSQDVSPIELIKITPQIPRKRQKSLIQHDFNQFLDNLKALDNRMHQQPYENYEYSSKNLTVKTESSKSYIVINKLKKNQTLQQDDDQEEEYSIWDNQQLEDQGYDCQSFLNKEGKDLTFYQLYRLRQCQLFGNISQQITIDYVYVISNHYKHPIQRNELTKQQQYLDNNYISYYQTLAAFSQTKNSNKQSIQSDHLDNYKKQHQLNYKQNTQSTEQVKKQIRQQTPQQNSYAYFQAQTIPLLAYYTPKQIQNPLSSSQQTPLKTQQTPLKIQQINPKQKYFLNQPQQIPKNILEKKKQFMLKDQQSQLSKSNNSTNSILSQNYQHNMSKQQFSSISAVKENIQNHSNQSKSSLRVFNTNLSNNFSFSGLSLTEKNTPNKKIKAVLSKSQQNYLNKLLLSSKQQNKQTNSFFRNSLRMLNKKPLSSNNSSIERNTPRKFIDGALKQLKQQNKLRSSQSTITIQNNQNETFRDKKLSNINQNSANMFISSYNLTEQETPKKIVKVTSINLFNKTESSLQQQKLNSQNVLQNVLNQQQQQHQSKIDDNEQKFNQNNSDKIQDKSTQLPKKVSNLLIFKAKNKLAGLQQKTQNPSENNQINIQKASNQIQNENAYCNVSQFNI